MSGILRAIGVPFVVGALLLVTLTASAADPADGRDVYNFRCYFCHGYSGDARTVAARMLDPKPRDFTETDLHQLPRERILDAVRNGRDNTAMKPFANVLSDEEIDAVVDFVIDEFMVRGAPNTRYHTAENGWPEHERFAAAFPFVRGELTLSLPGFELTPEQLAGRTLFLSSCISCHDVAGQPSTAPNWEVEAVSYPRTGFATGDFLDPPDAFSGATTFARHEIAPVLRVATSEQKRGEALFQANCAFCHARDGTGKNWIGTFMQPHPRDLTDPVAMHGMTHARLYKAIHDGLPGTSMPAWGSVLEEADIHSIIAYIDKVFRPVAKSE